MNTTTNQQHRTGRRDPHARASESAIARAIRDSDRKTRQRFPVLRYQTAIGMAFLFLGYGMAAVSAWLYLAGSLPAWTCILVNAVAFSLLRELEHDLIHNLYFKGRRRVQNLVLFVIWPALGNVPSPLYRRKMHLQHHRSSGTEADLEERLIGNGTGYGFMRWLTMFDTGLSTLFRRRELEQIPGFRRSELIRHLMPVVATFYIVWISFLVYHAASLGIWLLGFETKPAAGFVSLIRWIDALAIFWVLPNVVRQASLQVLSSSMHYYGDVEGLVQQTQVLTKWYWLPLQLLSCNFGSSHAIHHFVASQPFYLRELVRREAHEVMRKNGVRFDDLGTFKRANSWGEAAAGAPMPGGAGGADLLKSSALPGHRGDILHLELQGRLDAGAALEFEGQLLKSMDSGARRLSIDLSRLDSISDTGLRVLLHASRRFAQSDGKLALHSMNEPLKQAFSYTGLTLILPVHASPEEAVRWLHTAHSVTVC